MIQACMCTPAGTKYTVRVHRRAANTFSLTLGKSSVDAVIRTLNDGGLLVQARAQQTILQPWASQTKLF